MYNFAILFQYQTTTYFKANYSEEFTKALRAVRPRIDVSFDYEEKAYIVPDKFKDALLKVARKHYTVVDLTWSGSLFEKTETGPFGDLIAKLPPKGLAAVYNALARFYTTTGDDDSLIKLNEEHSGLA